MPKNQDTEKFEGLECWAIIEIFGHQRIAGKVKSENFGTACLLRVDVPEVKTKPRQTYDYDTKKVKKLDNGRVKAAFTRYLGVGAIYSLTPVTEQLARAAAAELSPEPVNIFGLESIKRLPAGDPEGE